MLLNDVRRVKNPVM